MPVGLVAALPAIFGLGSSIAGSFLSGTPKTSTNTTTNSSQSNSGSTASNNSTASVSPTFSPELQQLMTKLLGYSQGLTQDPTAALQPIRNSGLDSINRTYAAVPQAVTQQLANRGYGNSGSLGNSLYKVGLARAGAASDLEGQLATKGIDQQNFGAQLGTQLLNAGKGTTSTSSNDVSGYNWGSSAGTGTGTGTTPNTSLSNALLSGGNGLNNLSTLLMLQKVLSGGGGSDGGAAGSWGGGTGWNSDPNSQGG